MKSRKALSATFGGSHDIHIHAIDIVQPSGIRIPALADMDEHQTTVTAVLAAKSTAEIP